MPRLSLLFFLLLAHCSWAASLPLQLPQEPTREPGIVCVWLKANDAASEGASVGLTLKVFSEDQKARYQNLDSIRISCGDWTRLSGWVPRQSPSCQFPKIFLDSKNETSFSVGRVSWETLPDCPPPFPQGFLRVDGATLRNDAGSLLFRGVNVAAYSDDEKDKPQESMAKVTEDDYREISAIGFNAVRLACWQRILDSESGMDWLKLQVAFARKYGLYVIIDLHAPAGGYQSNNYKGPFWRPNEKGVKMQEQVTACWKKIAEAFKDEPAVAAYDLINEPLPKKDALWFDFAGSLIRTIRETGDTHAIVVETSMEDDSIWRKFDDPSIIYDTHWYAPWEFASQNEKKHFGEYGKEHRVYGDSITLNKEWLASQLAPYRKWCKEKNVPMQVGEYGISTYAETQGGLQWLADMVAIFEEEKVSRFFWCWHPFDMGLHPGWWRKENEGFRAQAAAIAAGKNP